METQHLLPGCGPAIHSIKNIKMKIKHREKKTQAGKAGKATAQRALNET
jgi:hypothetical protein